MPRFKIGDVICCEGKAKHIVLGWCGQMYILGVYYENGTIRTRQLGSTGYVNKFIDFIDKEYKLDEKALREKMREIIND